MQKGGKQDAVAEEKEKRPSKRPDLKAITKVPCWSLPFFSVTKVYPCMNLLYLLTCLILIVEIPDARNKCRALSREDDWSSTRLVSYFSPMENCILKLKSHQFSYMLYGCATWCFYSILPRDRCWRSVLFSSWNGSVGHPQPLAQWHWLHGDEIPRKGISSRHFCRDFSYKKYGDVLDWENLQHLNLPQNICFVHLIGEHAIQHACAAVCSYSIINSISISLSTLTSASDWKYKFT